MLLKLTLILFVALCVPGCVRELIDEEKTPAGSVPPAQTHRANNQSSTPAGVEPRDGRQPLGRRQVEELPVSTDMRIETETRYESAPQFAEAYRAAGSPRIAVLLNRALSADVREWRMDERLVVSGESRFSVNNASAAAGTAASTPAGAVIGGALAESSAVEVESKGDESTLGSQRRTPDEARAAPEEPWMWAFEQGFLRPFLEAGVSMIDRSTILRLDADYQAVDDKLEPSSVKEIEIESLRKHADLYVELLVTASPDSPNGYAFKATVKEVGTGTILANVTNISRRGEKKLVSTPDGYVYRPADEVEDEPELVATASGMELCERVPSVSVASERLAIRVMDALARRWDHNAEQP